MRTLLAVAFLVTVPLRPTPPKVPVPTLDVTTSELSPAVLVATTRPTISLFAGLGRWGLGAPAHAAWAARQGRTSISGSGALAPETWREAWTLLWFRGAPGWEAWDVPWLVVWQRRPARARLDEDGLHATAPGGLGTLALMPLYGMRKPDTRNWVTSGGLPPEVARQCRFWASVLRRYPLACEETTRVDGARGDIIVRSRFRWLTIDDDWRTPPRKLAPLPPTLALALRGGRLPATVTGPVRDVGLATPYGPYAGVEGTDGYDARFRLLHYLARTERDELPTPGQPIAEQALARLRAAMRDAFGSADGLFHQDFGDPPGFAEPPPQGGDGGNTCWAVVSAQHYCRSIPYLPVGRAAEARRRLRRYFADWVLQPGRYQPFRGKRLLVGPGIGTWGGYDDAGKFSSNVLVTLWAYARYTGDRALIRERWPLIKQLFVTPRECSWRGFGREEIAEMGDEAAPALAMARLAWLVGDREAYAQAAGIFAREIVHHVVKHTGSAYFVARQPFSSSEPMPADVYLTNLWGDTAGWQIDGPAWPKETGERQYTNRWVRFGDVDVARFHRDSLRDLDRAELDGLLASGRFTTSREGTMDDPHILPSMVRLRSLLLDESPERLARITPVDAPVHPASGVAAYCGAFLRTAHPSHLDTIIPMRDATSGWVKGIERDRPEDEPVLDVAVSWRARGRAGEPSLTWWGWRPPRAAEGVPGGDRWSFGGIRTDLPVRSGEERRLSWNTVRVRLTSGAESAAR